MVDRFERFSFAINEITRCWHRLAAEEMGKYGLKGPYSIYFTTMSRFPKGITAAKLGELCGRDKADVSRAIALMESKGLVFKDTSAKNTYRAPLKLTESGMELAQHINEKTTYAVELACRGIEWEKGVIFYEILETVTANMQTLSKNGFPVFETKEIQQE